MPTKKDKKEEIVKPTPFKPAPVKGDTPKLAEKPINKKIKNKKDIKA